MTERGRAALKQAPEVLTIGPSSVRWTGEALEIAIDEWTAPLPSRLRGTVTLRPSAIANHAYALDSDGHHHWRPIAPRARVEARFDGGALAWSGDGYFDCNWGDEPLERAFRSWSWSRAHTANGAHIHYDVEPGVGGARSLSLRFDDNGEASAIPAPPSASLPSAFWRVARSARGERVKLVRTLEDAPFYARSHLSSVIDGAAADIMHESLQLDRFRMPIVRAMLPFRMPRIAGWR
ncbi:MAG: hypothetical protein NW206_14135 [Hyphomonadaceae bacterium]|nr:hypothetical protein [Hyphomonadaceae bacterium]